MERKILNACFIYFCVIVGFFGAVSLYLYIYSKLYPKDPNDDWNEMGDGLIVISIGITFIYHLVFLLWARGLLKQKDTFNIFTKLQTTIIFVAGVCLPIYTVLNLFIL